MTVTFSNESSEYRAARNRLLSQEIELRRHMEEVAAARRALPPGPKTCEDYEFDGLDAAAQPIKVKLSQLFSAGADSLILYCYMFPRHKADPRDGAASGETARLAKAEQPCPSCTGLIDQLDAASLHFQGAGGNFAVVAKAPIAALRGIARDRGWKHVTLLSSSNNSFKRDYHVEDEDGQQMPVTLVFKRELDGTVRLFWASELTFADSDPGQDHRAQGTIEPFWNLFDLTPSGRPDFHEQLQYACCAGKKA